MPTAENYSEKNYDDGHDALDVARPQAERAMRTGLVPTMPGNDLPGARLMSAHGHGATALLDGAGEQGSAHAPVRRDETGRGRRRQASAVAAPRRVRHRLPEAPGIATIGLSRTPHLG